MCSRKYVKLKSWACLDVDVCYCAMSTDWSPPCQVHRGVPAFAVMYSAVGLGWLASLMTWPPVRPFMDKSYAVFARNRLKWTGRGDECKAGRCEIKSEKKWRSSDKTLNYVLDKQTKKKSLRVFCKLSFIRKTSRTVMPSENVILHDKICSVFRKI